MVTRAMDFTWRFCRGPHMFTGSLPEDSAFPVTSAYCAIKNDYNRSSFAKNIESVCQKNLSRTLNNKPPSLK